MCFPIKDGQEVLGVAELCNKTGAAYFSRDDEELATSFSIYCGISLMHGLMYKKVRDAQHRSHLSNELMMYHMKVRTKQETRKHEPACKGCWRQWFYVDALSGRWQVSHEETMKLISEQTISVNDVADFCEFTFIPRSMNESQTPAAVIAIFYELGLVERWSITRETLSR